jgi:hypothetical protein
VEKFVRDLGMIGFLCDEDRERDDWRYEVEYQSPQARSV